MPDGRERLWKLLEAGGAACTEANSGSTSTEKRDRLEALLNDLGQELDFAAAHRAGGALRFRPSESRSLQFSSADGALLGHEFLLGKPLTVENAVIVAATCVGLWRRLQKLTGGAAHEPSRVNVGPTGGKFDA